MTKQKNNKKKTKASDTNQPNIVMIPIEKIKHSRWGEGIRDKERYEQMKESIKIHGMRNPIHIRPIKNGFYEVHDGDHRLWNAEEDKWKEIACIIDENISDKEAHEIFVSTNITTGFNSVQLENQIYGMWKSEQYKSRAELGRNAGIDLSGQRVGQILKAKEIRDLGKSRKLTFDSYITTECIINASALKEDDMFQLLKLVKEGKIKPSDVKERAKELSQAFDETRRKYLYEGQPLPSVIGKISMPKKTISNKTFVSNPNLLPEIYEVLKTLEDYFAFIKDDAKRKEDINYVKFCASLLLKILYKQGVIHEDYFKDVVTHALKIDKEMLHHFTGLNTQGVDWWFDNEKVGE